MTDLRHVQDELTNKCSTCGFCYEYCPVFAATGDDPAGHKGDVRHKQGFFRTDYLLSSCLQCRACYPSCYNGLTTTEMVRRGRAAIVSGNGPDRFKKMMFNHILPHPGRMASLIKGFTALRRTGGISLARRLNITGEDVSTASELLDFDVETAIKRTPVPRSQEKAERQPVAYFRSCGFSAVLPCVGITTRALLKALGHPVIELENACCGLPAYAHGDSKAALRMAKKNIDLLARDETIVTECGSCSSFLKTYAGLFPDDEEYTEKARRLSERVLDMNDFLLRSLSQSAWHMASGDGTTRIVTYHNPCHLSRYQGITEQPRELLRSLSGIDFVELPESDRCCGGAGVYSIINRDISLKILDRKMTNVKKTGADVLATSCPACMIQLSYGAKRAGLNVTVMHVNQLIAESMGRSSDTGNGEQLQ